jgi:hypothetical protein
MTELELLDADPVAVEDELDEEPDDESSLL